jgi:SNF2 family DNA or RNA helicase
MNWQLTEGRLFFNNAPATLAEIERAHVNGDWAADAQLDGLMLPSARSQIKYRVSGSFPTTISLSFGITHRGSFVEVPLGREYIIVEDMIIPIARFPSELEVYEWQKRDENPVRLSPIDYLRLAADNSLDGWWVGDLNTGLVGDLPQDISSISVPVRLNATLSNYQIVGFGFLKTLYQAQIGSLLADEMGLGKTMQAIALICEVYGTSRILVVTPASLVNNWARELETFAPSIAIYLHVGANRSGSPRKIADSKLVLTSFETVVNDEALLGEVEWDLVIVDEAQYIRNPYTRRASAVKSLPRRVGIAITGTPIENKLLDLWSICDFALPGYVANSEDFDLDLADQLAISRSLGQIMEPITIRRSIEDVALDLPERSDVFVGLDLPEFVSNLLEEHCGGNKGGIVAQVICAHAHTLDVSIHHASIFSPKWQYLLDAVEQSFARGEKVLVFFSYIESIDRANTLLTGAFPKAHVDRISGVSPIDTRLAQIDEFSSTSGAAVLLLQIDAAGTGLNITAANHVFFFNPVWNPAVTAQAAARAFRRGQTLPVFVHHLYYLESVESEQISRSEYKKMIATGVQLGMSDPPKKAPSGE